jgi:hypothetical protein
MYSMAMFETFGAVGQISPASVAAGTVQSGSIDFSLVERIMAAIQSGVLSGGTIDFKFQDSATSGGTFGDIDTTCKIPQLTASSSIAELELRSESVAGRGKPWIQGALTIGTASSLVAVVIWGAVSHFKPVKQMAAVVSTTLYYHP